jgi:hypothetical protein
MWTDLNLSYGKTMKFKNYESDHTKFIRELKEKKPHLEEQQRANRAILWDTAPLDLDAYERDKQSRIKQQAYVYHSKS